MLLYFIERAGENIVKEIRRKIMNLGAIIMMGFGCSIVWGGLFFAIFKALKK